VAKWKRTLELDLIMATKQLSEQQVKHLEMLQQIISRMASNSFMLKGWSVTLVVGFFAVVDKTQIQELGLVALIPIVLFWILDGYFLRQERLFRKHYDFVRGRNSGDIVDFSMNTQPYEAEVNCVLKVMFSNTLFLFYLGLSVPTIIVLVGI
jgi:hypothetical protein